jgi:hypothetical protein
MSTPQNPLADFKSYSYYHVLAVCDSTDTAVALADNITDVVDTWKHPTAAYYKTEHQYIMDMGIYSPKSIGKGDGKYCVLINGATDASYVISKVMLNSVTAAGAVKDDRFTSLSVEGSMEISEPRGITFLDQVTRCCIALGKDASHVTFILKTFFVGYDHNDQIQTISNVAPITFIITEASGSFTEQGGMYSFSFVAMTHGAVRLPQYDKMVSTPPILGNTLKAVVDNLQSEVNITYERMYKCVKEQITTATATYPDSAAIIASLKPVSYEIRIADLYTNPEYTLSPPNAITSNTGVCVKIKPDATKATEETSLNAGPNLSVEEALGFMMRNCPQVKDDNSVKGIKTAITLSSGEVLPVGTQVDFRIHTKLLTPLNSTGGTNYIVIYTIEPFPVPRKMMSTVGIPTALLARNTLEFDYIYTGKNIDILEFDMKVNMGLAYLQIATLTNTFKNQGDPAAARTTLPNFNQAIIAANRLKPSDANEKHVDIPVFFSTNMELPMNRTVSDPPKHSTYMYDLTKQSSLESLDVSMKITGNVNLLHSVNASSLPRNDSSKSVAPYTAVTGQLVPGSRAVSPADNIGPSNIGGVPTSAPPDWGFVPGYAKVNIKMPRNNDDLDLFTDTDHKGYATPFWFTGYYYVYSVEHVFDEGEFTQNLQMIGMPDPEIFKQLDEHNQTKADLSPKIRDCYANTVKCPVTPVTTSKGKASVDTIVKSPAHQYVVTQPASQISPTDIDDLLLNQDLSPTRIKGYNGASVDVKQALQQAAGTGGVNLATLTMMAALESVGFSATSYNKSGATGLFQFLSGTWNGMPAVKRDSSLQVPPKSGQPDARLNPLNSALRAAEYAKTNQDIVGQHYPTIIYMCHLFGPGGCGAILKGSPSKKLMTQVYSEHPRFGTWEQVATQNSFKNYATWTADQIRPEIAARMHKHLVGDTVESQPLQLPNSPPVTSPSAPMSLTAKNAKVGEVIAKAKALCDNTAIEAAKTANPCGEGEQFRPQISNELASSVVTGPANPQKGK